jgi:hypothetical protein
MVMKSLSIASHSVSELLSLKLQVPPIPIASFEKEKYPLNLDEIELPKQFKQPPNKKVVYEIWKVFLEESDDVSTEVYVVISGDFVKEGYKNGKWKNIEYRGCYTTIKEAENQIDAYLHKGQ